MAGAKKSTKAKMPDVWQAAFYMTGDKKLPGLTYLTGLPEDVRKELLKTIAAVVATGPPRYPTGGPTWTLMHKSKAKGEVDMSGICEAKDKDGKLLYRIFCVIDRDAAEHGLGAASLILLGGATKKVKTVVPQSEYKVIDQYRHDYRATHRVGRLKKMPVWWP